MNPTARRLLNNIRKRKYNNYTPYTSTKYYVRVKNTSSTDANYYFKRCNEKDIPCLAEPCLFEMYMGTFYDKSWKLPVESSMVCIVCRLLREDKIKYLNIRIRTDDEVVIKL